MIATPTPLQMFVLIASRLTPQNGRPAPRDILEHARAALAQAMASISAPTDIMRLLSCVAQTGDSTLASDVLNLLDERRSDAASSYMPPISCVWNGTPTPEAGRFLARVCSLGALNNRNPYNATEAHKARRTFATSLGLLHTPNKHPNVGWGIMNGIHALAMIEDPAIWANDSFWEAKSALYGLTGCPVNLPVAFQTLVDRRVRSLIATFDTAFLLYAVDRNARSIAHLHRILGASALVHTLQHHPDLLERDSIPTSSHATMAMIDNLPSLEIFDHPQEKPILRAYQRTLDAWKATT